MPQKVENVLKTRHGTYLPLTKISAYVKYAAISSQDQRFYDNSGVDLRGNFRAVFYSITSGKRQGASTITEQLAKNVYFNDQDNLKTDIETKILALFITQLYPKDKILEMYLNEIYFGKLAYGISSASSAYFRTTPEKLTIAQSAYLMGLIDAPSYLQNNPKQAAREAGLVLEQMQKLKFITASQEQRAENSITSAHFSL
jgi:membrane peptidoglycan carboxypeptidase